MSFRVSLQVHASPCDTTVELMDGSWIVTGDVTCEAEQYITGGYNGSAIAAVRPCGTNL